MLIIDSKYNSIYSILKIKNETKNSDKFESKCVHYLRKNYPNHTFTLRGGSNNQVSDILVDDKFYIECKMTEDKDSKSGAQSTGFGLNIVNNLFECSNNAENNDSAVKILDYINNHFDEFSKFTKSKSGNLDLDLNQTIFAEWINSYYVNKNVLFFITIYDNEFVIFKNTVDNLLKYFNISATVRYYKYGTKNLPISKRDFAINALKKKYNVTSVKYDNNHTLVRIKGDIDSQYVETSDITIYLSDKNQSPGYYRLMRLSDLGTPRVIFQLHSKQAQDKDDLVQFNKCLD